jgi:hypothetical protein
MSRVFGWAKFHQLILNFFSAVQPTNRLITISFWVRRAPVLSRYNLLGGYSIIIRLEFDFTTVSKI